MTKLLKLGNPLLQRGVQLTDDGVFGHFDRFIVAPAISLSSPR